MNTIKDNNENIFLTLEGEANDLLMVGQNGEMKCTRLIQLPETLDENEEVIDVCVTSSNGYGEHPIFDKLLNKKIRITIELID